ncbi:MAG: GDP-mannose 4,6-dehydratase [Gemmatimonadales bacterium]|nr:GDP-mannose 4,6-dehydratase [Gemmatimonadales bacterium]
MKQLLITGADGFVGRWLTREALREGWQVIAVIGPAGTPPPLWLSAADARAVTHLEADFTEAADLRLVGRQAADAVIHLAAMASGAQARNDPDGAMLVNATGSAKLIEAIAESGNRPRFLFVSSGEVYGAGHPGPIAEETPTAPVSPYAISKEAAERAVLRSAEESTLPVIIARPFPHTGPGQSTDYVLPAFAARLLAARASGELEIPVGNLDVVRDFLDVRDVVRAYLLLLEHGRPTTCYNVASGTGQHLGACFNRLAELVGVAARPVPDPALSRPADIAVLVGDPSRLQSATGWTPEFTFDRTLQDLVNAQAH